MDTGIDNVTDIFSNLKAYVPTIFYADTRLYDECFGHCKENERNAGTDSWYIVRCLYCHADKLPCLGLTQEGRGCRRTSNLGDLGLCSHHDGSRYK